MARTRSFRGLRIYVTHSGGHDASNLGVLASCRSPDLIGSREASITVGRLLHVGATENDAPAGCFRCEPMEAAWSLPGDRLRE